MAGHRETALGRSPRTPLRVRVRRGSGSADPRTNARSPRACASACRSPPRSDRPPDPRSCGRAPQGSRLRLRRSQGRPASPASAPQSRPPRILSPTGPSCSAAAAVRERIRRAGVRSGWHAGPARTRARWVVMPDPLSGLSTAARRTTPATPSSQVGRRDPRPVGLDRRGRRVEPAGPHQPSVPGGPLNGPTRSAVIQPP